MDAAIYGGSGCATKLVYRIQYRDKPQIENGQELSEHALNESYNATVGKTQVFFHAGRIPVQRSAPQAHGRQL